MGKREKILRELINEYKYHSIRACGELLAQLTCECVELPQNAILVPLPTISKHVRERGFDHTAKMARHLARMSGARVVYALGRKNNTVQVGASLSQRKNQAEQAYFVRKQLNKSAQYVLVDDVWTTGSSMLAAAKKLSEEGITKIGAIIIAKSGG